MPKCVRPQLVSLELVLPTDPSTSYAGEPPVIGCNHLMCGTCGANVRHADGRGVISLAPETRQQATELYDDPAPASSALLAAVPAHATSRAYFCRCNWNMVAIRGSKDVNNIDQDWDCAGHEPDAITTARVPKKAISFDYAPGVCPSFATAAQLRDSLLASSSMTSPIGRPVVRVGRDGIAPAWGWLADLVRTRSDWWEVAGIALQHAAKDGEAPARDALADLCACYRDSIALLPWTAPIADEYPDAKPGLSNTSYGTHDFRLHGVIADQKKAWDIYKTGPNSVSLTGYGPVGSHLTSRVTNAAELVALLEQTAQAGQFPGGRNGPWSWLGFELIIGSEWIHAVFAQYALSLVDTNDHPTLSALLDWFFEERDLWRYHTLLVTWVERKPRWWALGARSAPAGWQYPIRSAFWPDVNSLGDVIEQVLHRAEDQLATPPVVDLPVLFGAS